MFSSLFKSFSHILMPRMCCVCDSALFGYEEVICTSCLFHLPITDFHLDKNNESAKQLWGKLDVEFASSMLYLAKSSKVEILIHRLKFKGFSEIGEYLGRLYGETLKDKLCNIDYIIPIPIHPSKLRKRGYNQAECFGLGLSQSLSIPLLTKSLIRSIASASQTTKNRIERYDNVANVFDFLGSNHDLMNKHVLLVDDVLTTGATLCTAGNILKKAGAKVSIVTLARA